MSKSIIRVEQPDIHLEEDEMQQAVDEDAMDVEPSAGHYLLVVFPSVLFQLHFVYLLTDALSTVINVYLCCTENQNVTVTAD